MPRTNRFSRPEFQVCNTSLAKLIEDKANDQAVIQMVAHEIPGVLPINTGGGKVARAAAVSPLIEAGNVYLPHP